MSWFRSNEGQLPSSTNNGMSNNAGSAGYARTSSASAQAPRGYTAPPPVAPLRPVQRQPVDYASEKSGLTPQTPQGVRSPRGRPGIYAVRECPSQSLPLTNCLATSEQDFPPYTYVKVKDSFVFTTIGSTLEPGCIGPARHQRTWAQLSFAGAGDRVPVELFDVQKQLGPDHLLGSITLELSLKNGTGDFDAEQLESRFRKQFDSVMFTVGQPLVYEFSGVIFQGSVKSLNVMELHGGGRGDSFMGILMAQTECTFLKGDGNFKIKASSKRAAPNAIIQPNFKFEDMGIGGLDAEFSNIFRRAFASRIFPPGLVDKLGIQHVKGILLYGPPGTGKTLMARQIGKMLNSREPKIVNGPEILNKFVGASEENIRKLFADAEKEYKEKGDESGLHIIIFDELDAICKQRGSTGGGTGVGDSVVNQLLSKMDGVDQLNNILLIGMTNRMDMIDEALLRPGRLEVHMEISLPDDKGRLQILKIHTAKIFKNGIMESDVDVNELASLTKNFSGAEIGGLVKSATSFAFNRHVKVGTQAGIGDDIDKLRINRSDFMHALEEVKPAFGVAEEELSAVVQNGIIRYAPHIDAILRDGALYVEQVRKSDRTPLVSVLIHGPPSAGKTALAATIAIASDFPFIKLISSENMIGYSEAQKINYLNKVFTDSYKSKLSVVVVDGIERILDWVPIGPRFSNSVLQALMVLLSKRPPKGHRLLILATTSSTSMLHDMQLYDSFAADIPVPAVDNLDSLIRIVDDVKLFRDQADFKRAVQLLQSARFGEDGRFSIGIKKLLGLVEMARQDPSPADKLVSGLLNTVASIEAMR
ncbi:uncharacterized protein L969DRAFT_84044 [Mixia osmundae IAM 14324]|nr:uncharacterized protein L969DRAFT_84044 [Mixia osmundae IAM 14324]KEI42172.1 hypothetical protein L969DRAFT_84044 [Mixia osmundae IAM 14324]